jgi:hypothetical protein
MAVARFRERTSFLFLFCSLYYFLSLFSTYLGVNQISPVILLLLLQLKHNFCIDCSYLATHSSNYLGFFWEGGGGGGGDILQLWGPLLFKGLLSTYCLFIFRRCPKNYRRFET